MEKSTAHGQYPSSLVLMFLWAKISWRARSVLMVLVVRANREKKATLLRKTIQKACGFAKVKDVDAGVNELLDVNLIKRHHRTDPEKGEYISSEFELCFDPKDVPFAKMPAWIVDEGIWADMHVREQSVLIVLKALAHGNSFHQIAQRKLCTFAGISDVKYLREALEKLTERGFIRVEETKLESGAQGESKYHLLV